MISHDNLTKNKLIPPSFFCHFSAFPRPCGLCDQFCCITVARPIHPFLLLTVWSSVNPGFLPIYAQLCQMNNLCTACAQSPINHNFLLWPCSSANSTTTVSHSAKSPPSTKPLHLTFFQFMKCNWISTLKSSAVVQRINLSKYIWIIIWTNIVTINHVK